MIKRWTIVILFVIILTGCSNPVNEALKEYKDFETEVKEFSVTGTNYYGGYDAESEEGEELFFTLSHIKNGSKKIIENDKITAIYIKLNGNYELIEVIKNE